ncbi:hypothetical protein CPB84DRAFT_1821801 [Gymnopilus junonius]|uniref:Uncharacterized protein n=1 Tax=Gymnopilus junonius TaxID=109634 RepID=A0A9P5NU32_GYMJU|nr:hypothetical protein CPB84DRAFT_1821801 [Gymnopilus junonius]
MAFVRNYIGAREGGNRLPTPTNFLYEDMSTVPFAHVSSVPEKAVKDIGGKRAVDPHDITSQHWTEQHPPACQGSKWKYTSGHVRYHRRAAIIHLPSFAWNPESGSSDIRRSINGDQSQTQSNKKIGHRILNVFFGVLFEVAIEIDGDGESETRGHYVIVGQPSHGKRDKLKLNSLQTVFHLSASFKSNGDTLVSLASERKIFQCWAEQAYWF